MIGHEYEEHLISLYFLLYTTMECILDNCKNSYFDFYFLNSHAQSFNGFVNCLFVAYDSSHIPTNL